MIEKTTFEGNVEPPPWLCMNLPGAACQHPSFRNNGPGPWSFIQAALHPTCPGQLRNGAQIGQISSRPTRPSPEALQNVTESSFGTYMYRSPRLLPASSFLASRTTLGFAIPVAF